MGKYSNLKDALDKFAEAPAYQQKLDAIKDFYKIRGLDVSDISPLFLSASEDYETAQKLADERKAIKAAFEQELLTAMADDDLSSIKLTSGTLLYVQSEPYSTVEDKTLFNPWIDAEGLSELKTLNYQTFSALVKERLLKGEPIPPGVKVFMKDSIRKRG